MRGAPCEAGVWGVRAGRGGRAAGDRLATISTCNTPTRHATCQHATCQHADMPSCIPSCHASHHANATCTSLMPTARTLTRAHTSQGRRETLSQAQRAQRSRGAQAASLLAAVEGGGSRPHHTATIWASGSLSRDGGGRAWVNLRGRSSRSGSSPVGSPAPPPAARLAPPSICRHLVPASAPACSTAPADANAPAATTPAAAASAPAGSTTVARPEGR